MKNKKIDLEMENLAKWLKTQFDKYYNQYIKCQSG